MVLPCLLRSYDFVPGRLLKDPRLPEVPAADRTPIYDTMASALAALHSVDPVASGLETFGPPKDFVARCVPQGARCACACGLVNAMLAHVPTALCMSQSVTWLQAYVGGACVSTPWHVSIRLRVVGWNHAVVGRVHVRVDALRQQVLTARA